MGATETVLLSAVLAEGKTVLRGAATEPEVVALALFLQRMGAHIEPQTGPGSSSRGCAAARRLGPAVRRPARAVSYLVAG